MGRGVLEFLTEVHEKLAQVRNDLRCNEVKIDPSTVSDLNEKDQQVNQMIAALTSKVGYVSRGNVIVSGGLTPGYTSYGGGGGEVEAIGNENRETSKALVDKDSLAKMMQDEMKEQE